MATVTVVFWLGCYGLLTLAIVLGPRTANIYQLYAVTPQFDIPKCAGGLHSMYSKCRGLGQDRPHPYCWLLEQ